MNISFIDYSKRIESIDKKISKYESKIAGLANNYEMPVTPEMFDEKDKKLYSRYMDTIEKSKKLAEVYQEKAKLMAESGKVALTLTQKAVSAVVAVAMVGGAGYANLNSSNVASTSKNNIPTEDTDSLDQSQDGMIQSNDNQISTNGSSANGETKANIDYKDELDGTIPENSMQVPAESGNNGTSNNNDTSDKEPQLPGSYDEPVAKVESLYETVLTDINDEAQVYARAKYIKENYYDVYLPQQYVTIEEVEEQIRQVGAGICEEVSFESANNTIVVINDLMFREEGDATDRVNSVITTREETLGNLDLGLFCVDGTKGQMLLHQLSELRTAMIQGAGREDISDLQKEYAELFLSSTLLQGYNSIDINSLETGGMKYLTGIAFLNTATFCGDFSQILIENPLTLEIVSLQSIIDKFKNAKCSTTMIDENGKETGEEVTLNYLGTYFFEMVSDNYNKKSMYGQDFGKGLK